VGFAGDYISLILRRQTISNGNTVRKHGPLAIYPSVHSHTQLNRLILADIDASDRLADTPNRP